MVQTGTALLRGASTVATAGLGNPVLATAENTGAVGSLALILLLPLVASGLVVLLVVFILSRLGRWRARRRASRAHQLGRCSRGCQKTAN
ncbi:MAG: DUF4126 domain-containing protein [Bacteroidota bacterium]|nr:DUF4126 domain-containing protein [Bacteroidota bacterium]